MEPEDGIFILRGQVCLCVYTVYCGALCHWSRLTHLIDELHVARESHLMHLERSPFSGRDPGTALMH